MIFFYIQIFFWKIHILITMYYWNYGIHITCLYLSEALSGFYASSHPRLRSLRSLSLGILRTSLSDWNPSVSVQRM